MKQGRWLLGVLLVCLAACGGEAEPTPLTDPPTQPTTGPTTAPTSSTVTSVATTTTTSDPTVTTDPGALDLTHPDAPAPEVNLEAETWGELLLVFGDIRNYWTWMNSHPTLDPLVLETVLHAEGPEIARQAEGMEFYVNNKERVIGVAFGDIRGIGCCLDPDEQMKSGSIRLMLRTDSPSPSAIVVDPDGVTVRDFPGWNNRELLVELRRDEEGRWLVWQLG